MASETLTELLVAESPCMLNASGVNIEADTLTRKYDTVADDPVERAHAAGSKR